MPAIEEKYLRRTPKSRAMTEHAQETLQRLEAAIAAVGRRSLIVAARATE